jgi:hypothetical protein
LHFEKKVLYYGTLFFKTGDFMKNKKKNGNSMETLKRQFMRMQSPSAFGAARRFDSASFMNVPPKWPAGMPPTTSFHPFS